MNIVTDVEPAICPQVLAVEKKSGGLKTRPMLRHTRSAVRSK